MQNLAEHLSTGEGRGQGPTDLLPLKDAPYRRGVLVDVQGGCHSRTIWIAPYGA